MEYSGGKIGRRGMLAAAGSLAVWDSSATLGATTTGPLQGIPALAQYIDHLRSPGGGEMVGIGGTNVATVVPATPQKYGAAAGGADDTAAFQAAVNDAPARGSRITLLSGVSSLAATWLVAREDISINGASQKSSQIEADHHDSAIKFVGQVNDLANGKFALSDLYLTKKKGNALVGGYPRTSFVGTGLELAGMFCGDIQRLQVDRFGTGLDLSSVYMSTFNQFFARNCWMGLKCSTPVDGASTGNIFIGGCFNNSAFDLTNGEKFTFIGTDFEASSTTCVVSSRNIFQNCRFERMSLDRPFFTWLDIQGDFNKLVGSQFFWDASTSVDDEVTNFYVQIGGDSNEIEAQKLFVSRNFVLLASTSSANTILFNAPFTDYVNTGNNNAYRRSGRLFIDKGTGNRIVFDNADGRVEVIGTQSMEASGNLSNFLRFDPMSNLVIHAETLRIAQSNIAGPCGIAASHVDNKKFTIASGASMIRARTPDLVASANGSTVYSISCFVFIPSGRAQPTKVRIGDGSGVFTDIYPADGTDRWHWVPVFTQPAHGNAVQLMIEAEGDVNDVFYVALPSVSEGNTPAYVPVPRGKTSWTAKTTARKVGVADIQNSYGAPERGSFTPGLTFGGVAQIGLTASGQFIFENGVVDAWGFIALSSVPGGTGAAVITGLPYDTSANRHLGAFAGNITPVNMTWVGNLSVATLPGSKMIELFKTNQADPAGARTAMTDASFIANSYFHFNVRYSV